MKVESNMVEHRQYVAEYISDTKTLRIQQLPYVSFFNMPWKGDPPLQEDLDNLVNFFDGQIHVLRERIQEDKEYYESEIQRSGSGDNYG